MCWKQESADKPSTEVQKGSYMKVLVLPPTEQTELLFLAWTENESTSFARAICSFLNLRNKSNVQIPFHVSVKNLVRRFSGKFCPFPLKKAHLIFLSFSLTAQLPAFLIGRISLFWPFF